jgi:hypothetical protein
LPYVFVTEREGPMTAATARKLITRAGELAKLPFPICSGLQSKHAGLAISAFPDSD